ncbi:hypothetical protein [Allocoleopsis sp.]|uniref:hypothetical protein n=1 Tax=Allocoleopsis sp. TaxID=3088169 RepID=UPI002FD2A85F
MVQVEVGENIVAEMLCSADLINDEKPVFSSSSFKNAIAPPGRISAIACTL